MIDVFELETKYSRVEVWEKDSLEEIDVFIGFSGDAQSVSLSSEQADAVAIALIQATPYEEEPVFGITVATIEDPAERLRIGLAMIRSAR